MKLTVYFLDETDEQHGRQCHKTIVDCACSVYDFCTVLKEDGLYLHDLTTWIPPHRITKVEIFHNQ